MPDFLQDPQNIASLQGPNPLNNPELGKLLAMRRAQAASPQPAQPQPAPVPQEPATIGRVEHTHDIAGLAPQPTANQGPLATVKAAPKSPGEAASEAEVARLSGSKPGFEQVKNPFLRGLATVGNVVASGFFPGAAAAIPGTSIHHQVLLRNAENALGTQAKERESVNTGEETAAKANQANSIAEAGRQPYIKVGKDGLYDAQSKTWIREPSDAQEGGTVHETKEGNYVVIHPNGKADVVTANGEPVNAPPPKEGVVKEGEMPLGERVPQINAAMRARYQVLHPGQELPPHYQLPENATQKDFDRTDKLIEGEEKAFGTKENQAQTAELRKQTMALAAQNREKKDETSVRQATMKAYAPALDSAERFNVMAKNYEDAVKNHDQQAMLSLLANHLGMTMGLQKGARMTRDIIREAQQSRPWLQGMEAKFDKDGYLTGVTLTPQQMRQMVDLGRSRFSEDTVKARNEAEYMGAKDEGPKRTPNQSTINHYIGLANGDATKAKELAAADGWTVK